MMNALAVLLLCLSCIGWTWGSGWNQGDIPATDVKVNTTNFSTNLSGTDTDVQKALETLDSLIAGGAINWDDPAAVAAIAAQIGWTHSTGKVYLSTSGDNVGIGSANPRSKLDVDGAVYATTYYGSAAGLTDLPESGGTPGGSSTQIQYNAAGALGGVDGFIYNGTALSYTGNIGLGSINPTQKLDVAGTVKATEFIGSLTGTASGNLVSGGTLTSAYHCRYDGKGIDCDRVEDASGACASNAVCMGGHTHVGVNEIYGAGWNADTSTPEKNNIYDWGHLFDTDDDGKVNVLDIDAGVVQTNASGIVSALSSDGSGDCASGAVCLGDHTHSSYLTTDTKWDGGATGLNASTGRTSLELGTAAQSAATDFLAAGGTAVNSSAVEGTDLGTLTDGKVCTYDLAGTEIDCNTTMTVDTNTNAGTICSGGDVYLNGEGQCVTIDSTVYQTAGTYMTGATSSQGLAVSSTTLGIQDCAANQIMKRNAGDTAWECATDATGAGGGYTNLTEFVDQGNWKVFYSDGSGDVKELTTGAYGYALMGQGTTSAPAFVDMAIYALDTDLAGYVPTTRTVNGKALSSNITLSQYDVDLSLYAKLVSPSFTTPTLGSATATTINKVTITAPASSATLTIADGKTLTATNTVNLNTMTDGKYCTYTASGTALNCNSDAGSGLSGLTAGKIPKASNSTTIVDSVIYENTNVGIGVTSPSAKLAVDGAVYFGSGTPSPTWGGVSMASAGDGYFMGDVEVDGALYVDATGDTLLNVTSGNVGIGTTNALAQLHIDGAIYSQNLTAGGSHGTAKLLCLGIDGFVYSVSSGGCF